MEESAIRAGKKIAELASWEEHIPELAQISQGRPKVLCSHEDQGGTRAGKPHIARSDTKSAEIVAQLKEVEALSRSLTDRLEKQVAEMRVQLEELSNQHRVLQQKLSESQISSEGYTNQIAELKKLSPRKIPHI